MKPILRLALTTALVVSPAASTRASEPDGAARPPAASPRPRRRATPRAPAVVATFPGFRMNPDGTSRCFVHLSAAVEATSSSSPRRFEVLLPGTGVTVRNHLHPLETRFFNTPMLRAHLERRGRSDLALVIELRADVTLSFRTEAAEGGGQVVVVDLPAGQFVEGPPTIGGEIRPSDPDSRGESGRDDERPPILLR